VAATRRVAQYWNPEKAEQLKDDKGNPVVDDDGNPVYETFEYKVGQEMQRMVVLRAAGKFKDYHTKSAKGIPGVSDGSKSGGASSEDVGPIEAAIFGYSGAVFGADGTVAGYTYKINGGNQAIDSNTGVIANTKAAQVVDKTQMIVDGKLVDPTVALNVASTGVALGDVEVTPVLYQKVGDEERILDNPFDNKDDYIEFLSAGVQYETSRAKQEQDHNSGELSDDEYEKAKQNAINQYKRRIEDAKIAEKLQKKGINLETLYIGKGVKYNNVVADKGDIDYLVFRDKTRKSLHEYDDADDQAPIYQRISKFTQKNVDDLELVNIPSVTMFIPSNTSVVDVLYADRDNKAINQWEAQTFSRGFNDGRAYPSTKFDLNLNLDVTQPEKNKKGGKLPSISFKDLK